MLAMPLRCWPPASSAEHNCLGASGFPCRSSWLAAPIDFGSSAIRNLRFRAGSGQPAPGRLRPVGFCADGRLCSSGRMLAATLPLLSGRFQLAVAFCVDLLLPAYLRRDVAGGAVQADVIVVVHVAFDQTPCIFQRQRRAECTHSFAICPSVRFSVRLRVKRRSPDVSDSCTQPPASWTLEQCISALCR